MTTASGVELTGVTLHPGLAAGRLLPLDAPLSFWGGSDLRTGRITDERHPQCGVVMAGRIVVMHSGRGSSSSSSVLAEQIRAGVSPAAILLSQPDAVIVVGAIVAAELYGTCVPIVLLTPAEIDSLTHPVPAQVDASASGARVRWAGPAAAPAIERITAR